MAMALALAERGLGYVWPNPAVGCVIVDKDEHLVGRGWTQPGGRPHAEAEALRQAGAKARGATAFVSLEPCSHHGKTGPCSQALIDAGLARVVTAHEDPDLRVSGRGHAMLKGAGVALRTEVLRDRAHALNEGFFSRIAAGRPLVTLKLATTLDGKIAMLGGESRWITGERARAHAHLMRARHDAVMIGIGTALTDDPELTCRLPGVDATRLVRLVADSNARLPVSSKLVAGARTKPLWLLTSKVASPERVAALHAAGAKLMPISAQQRLDISAALKALAAEGVTRILVEGGAALSTSLLKKKLVDRLLWYRAPSLMGEGLGAVASLGFAALKDIARFTREETITLGDDVLETYRAAT